MVDLTAMLRFQLFFCCIVTCVVIISSLCKPLDRRSNGLLCFPVYSLLFIFFKPFDLNRTAVMICLMIESGPPDSSDGPDLICLSQTPWPIFLNRFDPPRAQFTNRPIFMLKHSFFFYCFANYTSVFIYYTIFFQKFIFSLFSFL